MGKLKDFPPSSDYFEVLPEQWEVGECDITLTLGQGRGSYRVCGVNA